MPRLPAPACITPIRGLTVAYISRKLLEVLAEGALEIAGPAAHLKRDSPWPWIKSALALTSWNGESCTDETPPPWIPVLHYLVSKMFFPHVQSEPPKLHFVCVPWVKVCDIRPTDRQKQRKRPVEQSGNSAMKDVR